MKPSIGNLKQIIHEEKMKKKWAGIKVKQKSIREKKNKRRQELIDNDREHLISTSRYWPPLTYLSRKQEFLRQQNQKEGDMFIEYPSGYEWMHTYRPWADAVLVHSIKAILVIIALIAIWNIES
tara:strand:- start:173 stop:544 length:372 start_codon:yes stop_codon:yes gene_type:complete